jgi:RNA polymerase sigma-70 factor (ECF subfamily)
MSAQAPGTVEIQRWIDRLRAGDESARAELLNSACERLGQLTRKMLGAFPRVHRWEQTDDVLQNASLRLYRALHDVTPQTAQEFFGLAALNIRRELLDLAKHYYGPQGLGARHASADPADTPGGAAAQTAAPDLTNDPGRLAAWAEFHERVAALPADERQVFDLLWYQGLEQAEAADVLGVSERTVKRRWQSARVRLYEALGGELPGV